MAGYYIYSLDADVFEQLTTSPTTEQALVLAETIVEELEYLLDEYADEDAADPKKWPRKRPALAESIRKRLASPDWYADMTHGDAVIWEQILRQLDDVPGEQLEIDFRCENDGFLYWDAANLAAKNGASMMAEPKFGNRGFRYSGKSRGDLELMYTLYLPQQVQLLLQQLEKVVPFFKTQSEEKEGNRDQFFRGLLEPVRKISAKGRVMWVQTDT
jgi:hypothetical protein